MRRHEDERRITRFTETDAIRWRRTGEQHQSWNRIVRSAGRRANSAAGSSAQQSRFLFRCGDFCGHDVDSVSRIDALPCVAANARENYFTDAGSFGDFFANRRDIHTPYARPASGVVGFHHTRACLGARHFRRDLKNVAGGVAPSETWDDSLSWHRLVGINRDPADHAGNSVSRGLLAGSRWRCLYHWRALFRERTSALQPLHLAFVRASRFELSFSRDSLLLRDLRGAGAMLQSIKFLVQRGR